LPDELDISGILGNLDHLGGSASTADLDAVFDDLRTEAEKEDAEFASQYIKLASTYIDMGMMDDAMTALRTAAETPSQRFEAASMLGRMHTQRGETAKAIEWLQRAAEEPAPNLVEGRALLYDLGVMLDRNVEFSRALAVFLELQADAGDYRDVPARIDRLARVQSGG
jgi:Flp pilus assembly protein TadD